jgi:hypothetical protein
MTVDGTDLLYWVGGALEASGGGAAWRGRKRTVAGGRTT